MVEIYWTLYILIIFSEPHFLFFLKLQLFLLLTPVSFFLISVLVSRHVQTHERLVAKSENVAFEYHPSNPAVTNFDAENYATVHFSVTFSVMDCRWYAHVYAQSRRHQRENFKRSSHSPRANHSRGKLYALASVNCSSFSFMYAIL